MADERIGVLTLRHVNAADARIAANFKLPRILTVLTISGAERHQVIDWWIWKSLGIVSSDRRRLRSTKPNLYWDYI